MKKFTSLFSFLAVFVTATMAQATEYQYVAGNMTNSHPAAGAVNRKLNSFTITDGTTSLAISDIQSTYTSPVYVDKTVSKLTAQQGAALSFSAFDWTGSWMHAYVFIDYNNDKVFDAVANNDGTVKNGDAYGEVVSYNFYQDKDINGNAGDTNGNAIKNSYSNTYGESKAVPAFRLPADLPAGEYRVRVKIDWNNIDGNVGASDIASSNGCQCDFTLVVETASANAAAKAALKAAIDELDTFLSSIRVGNKVSEYSSSLDDADAMFAGAKAFYGVVDSETAIADIEDCTATVRAIKDSYSENVLEDGKFYYIHSACTNSGYANGYVYASLSSIKYDSSNSRNERNGGCWEVTTTPTVKHTWKCEIVDGTAYLKNLHTASYIKGIVTYLPARLSETEKAPITINKLGDGQVNILVNGTQAHAQTGNSEYFFVPWDGGKNSASAWYIEEVSAVPSHTLTIAGEEWSTVLLGYNATIPNVDGFKAYTVSAVDNDQLKLTEVTGVLGANTAIIVKAVAGDYEFAYTTAEATVESKTAVLLGTLYDKDVAAEGVVYDLVEGKFQKGEIDVTLANKAYLVLPSEQAVSDSFSLVLDDNSTAINEVVTEGVNVVYDLQGRVVENPANGIYIVGGKKVLLK